MTDRAPNRNAVHRASARRSATFARLAALTVTGAVAGGTFAVPAASQSMFDPASQSARRVNDLWWLMFWMGTAIFVLVMLLLLYAVARGRRGDTDGTLDRRWRQSMVIGGGVIMPVIVLAIVYGATLRTLTGLADDRSSSELTVEVVAHQFWWEVRYPDEDIVTANEIHIPVGEPVEFQLTSADVIHSFWVPELYGKVDMMPGTTTSVTFTADEPGRYRGQCAQLCGIQHANMAMFIVAQEPEEFSGWMDNQRRDAEPPAEGSVLARGEEIFLSSSCMYCHTVRGSGSPAQNEFGPDLTHLASRETIAAGILDNTTGTLASWIVDPQHLKPGNAMPATNLSGEELQALLAYLNSLD